MTFFDISLKMLRANFRRYRLYFLCNLFATVLFYCFAAFATDRRFMDIRVVDSMISGNIIAPTLFAGVFLVLFLPYSYGAFLRSRKHEYGVLMALGMGEGDVLKNMIAEACAVAALSLLCGLALGTGLSVLFYTFVHGVIGVAALQWQWNADSYRLTCMVYGGAMVLTLVTALVRIQKSRVVELLKEKFRAERQGRASLPVWITGAVLMAASAVFMAAGGGSADGRFLLSLGAMFLGSLLVYWNAGILDTYLDRKLPGFRQRNFLGLAFARQHAQSRRRVGFFAAWMIGFAVFFTGFGAAMAPSLTRNALNDTPYDLVYSHIFGRNQVADADVEGLLNQHGVRVTALRQAEYLRSKAFNVLSATEANRVFGSGYSIAPGTFMEVFWFDPNDGYAHDTLVPQFIDFRCAGETLTLRPIGSEYRILFNGNPTFADFTLIVSDTDYARLAAECRDFWKGTMKLYTLDNWRVSAQGVEAVQGLLAQSNHAGADEQLYYCASSRIETYTTAQRSTAFFAFVMAFVIFLFCAASYLIVLFKIRAEGEEERRLLAGLRRIGVTQAEMKSAIRCKNRLYFLPQTVVGFLFGVFFIVAVVTPVGYGWAAAAGGVVAGLVLFALHGFGASWLARVKI